MPRLSTSQRWTARKSSKAPGMTKTCRAKKRLSESPPITGPPRSRRTTHGPEDRHAPGHRPADRQAPVGVRVPAEDLAGEEHAQGAEEQEHAQDPGQLARVLVGPVQEDLGHVHQHQHDHARPGVVVQRPQEPAQRLRRSSGTSRLSYALSAAGT